MPIAVDKKRARRVKAAVEKALAAGHPPPGVGRGDNRITGALAFAADAVGEPRETVRNLCRRGGALEAMGLAVDWSLYRARALEPQGEPPSGDPIEIRRARDATAAAVAAKARAERDILAADGLRRAVMMGGFFLILPLFGP